MHLRAYEKSVLRQCIMEGCSADFDNRNETAVEGPRLWNTAWGHYICAVSTGVL